MKPDEKLGQYRELGERNPSKLFSFSLAREKLVRRKGMPKDHRIFRNCKYAISLKNNHGFKLY
jgi:hypothetical protein